MTLRNKKVLEKKKTPPIKTSSRKNTPLVELNKNSEIYQTDKKLIPGNKSEAKKRDKENSVTKKQKPRNKQNNKEEIKEGSSTLEKSTKTLKNLRRAKKEPVRK